MAITIHHAGQWRDPASLERLIAGVHDHLEEAGWGLGLLPYAIANLPDIQTRVRTRDGRIIDLIA